MVVALPPFMSSQMILMSRLSRFTLLTSQEKQPVPRFCKVHRRICASPSSPVLVQVSIYEQRQSGSASCIADALKANVSCSGSTGLCPSLQFALQLRKKQFHENLHLHTKTILPNWAHIQYGLSEPAKTASPPWPDIPTGSILEIQ